MTYAVEGRDTIWIDIYDGPSTQANLIKRTDLEILDCLGKENGWYKVDIDGKVGYVHECEDIFWDGMDTI